MEGGTTAVVQSALVQLKCEHREAELLRAEAMEALASVGEVADVKAASPFDAENSDPAANIGDLTMTAVAFDRQRGLFGEVDALDSHKQGRQTSIESTKQLRSVMGEVEGIEKRFLLSRTLRDSSSFARVLAVWTCTEVRGASVLYRVSDEMQVNCKGNPCCCDTDI